LEMKGDSGELVVTSRMKIVYRPFPK